MCFNPIASLTPKMPKLAPLPDTPTIDSDAVRLRALQEEEALAAKGGTAGTVKTDLAPASLSGGRRVLLGASPAGV